MKGIIYIKILFNLCFLPTLYAQQPIVTKWYYDLTDTTIKDKVYARYIRPYDIIEADSKDIVLGTFQFNYGWSARRIEKSTGKEIWTARRNAYVPDSTNKMFTYDNLFLREDGDIEVLGVRSKTDAHSSYGDGNPIRSVYDINTGKEKSVTFVAQPNNFLTSVIKTGVVGAYVPKPNGTGYYMLNYNRFGNICMSIRGLDTNLLILDTLTNITVCKDTANPFLYALYSTGLRQINNHLYFIVSTWSGSSDTTGFGHYLYQIDLDGKVKSLKNVAKEVFYNVSHRAYFNYSDGFAIAGLIDTTYKRKFNNLMCTKIDTNGNKQWRVFLKQPSGLDSMDVIAVGEDLNRKGSWLLLGSSAKRGIYLYFIDNKGVATFLREVKLAADNPKNLLPTDIWVLNDGNLYFTSRYRESLGTVVATNFTLSMIEAHVLDDLLKTVKTEDAVLKKDMIMYPNPANQLLNLYFTDGIDGKVFIINNLGKICKSIRLDNNELYQIDVSDLAEGIYYVSVQENNQFIFTDKLVIIK
jgi:hypothetical protein